MFPASPLLLLSSRLIITAHTALPTSCSGRLLHQIMRMCACLLCSLALQPPRINPANQLSPPLLCCDASCTLPPPTLAFSRLLLLIISRRFFAQWLLQDTGQSAPFRPHSADARCCSLLGITVALMQAQHRRQLQTTCHSHQAHSCHEDQCSISEDENEGDDVS